MAGLSSRFFNAGYKIPKYMLSLGDSNVFRESVSSFKFYFKTDTFIFIIRPEFKTDFFVEQECKLLGILDYKIVILEHNTRGQAETVKIGLERAKIDNKDSFYVFNIDSIRLNFKKPSEVFLENVDGFLEVFEDSGSHWSFIEPLQGNFVKRTTEKVKISNLCSNGLYYFSSFELFNKSFTEMEQTNLYSEMFIAPMYNFHINNGLKVKYSLLSREKILFAGTPKEYENLKSSYYD